MSGGVSETKWCGKSGTCRHNKNAVASNHPSKGSTRQSWRKSATALPYSAASVRSVASAVSNLKVLPDCPNCELPLKSVPALVWNVTTPDHIACHEPTNGKISRSMVNKNAPIPAVTDK